MAVKICTRCHERFDAADADVCMSCLGIEQMASLGCSSLADLPPHRIKEQGINAVGQRYARVVYADSSEDLIDPIPWDESLDDRDDR